MFILKLDSWLAFIYFDPDRFNVHFIENRLKNIENWFIADLIKCIVKQNLQWVAANCNQNMFVSQNN